MAKLRQGRWPDYEKLDAEALDVLRQEFARTSFEGFEFGALALRTRHETLSRLASLQTPTLIVRGENEDPRLVRVAEDLARTIPGARSEVIPGAGHSPQIETPEAFNRLLLDFLASLP